MYTFSGRDLVNFYHQKRLENGTHIAVAQSIETSKVPEVSGVVRATALLIGSVFGKSLFRTSSEQLTMSSPASNRPQSLHHHPDQSYRSKSQLSFLCKQLHYFKSDALVCEEATQRHTKVGRKELNIITVIKRIIIFWTLNTTSYNYKGIFVNW